MTHERFLLAARLAKETANEGRAALSKFARLAGFHNANGLSAVGAATPPDWLLVDAAGNIEGTDFAVADYLNFMNFIGQLGAMVDGGQPAQGDYRSVVNRVADA